MPTIEVAKIKISPTRQRDDLGDLSSLKESMTEVGLIHPIVIDDMNVLIAGERRLTSAQELQWDTIEYRRFEHLNDHDKQKIELEENLHRKDLTAEEKLNALKLLHDLLSVNNPTNKRGPVADGSTRHTVQDTADIVGRSNSVVSMELEVANAMAILPADLQKVIYDKAGNGGIAAVKRELEKAIGKAAKTVDVKERASKAEAQLTDEDKANASWADIRNVDCLSAEGLVSLADGSIDIIITDPPYGALEDSVFNKKYGDAESTQLKFDDSTESVMEVLSKAIPEFYRVLADNSHMYMFCSAVAKDPTVDSDSTPHFASLAKLCIQAGFTVRTAPLIWSKTNIQGVAGNNQQWPYAYEAILFARKGTRPINTMPKGDVLSHTPIWGTNKRHKTQKPYKLLDQLLYVSGTGGGLCLDPFCGSGSTLVAAKIRGLRVCGFELDEQTALEAREWLIKTGNLSLKENIELTKECDGEM